MKKRGVLNMMTLIQSTNNEDIYESHDYEFTIHKNRNRRDFTCKGKYNIFQIYFDIRYNRTKNEFFANYTSPFMLSVKDKEMWTNGLNNTIDFLDELNQNVNILMQPQND